MLKQIRQVKQLRSELKEKQESFRKQALIRETVLKLRENRDALPNETQLKTEQEAVEVKLGLVGFQLDKPRSDERSLMFGTDIETII